MLLHTTGREILKEMKEKSKNDVRYAQEVHTNTKTDQDTNYLF